MAAQEIRIDAQSRADRDLRRSCGRVGEPAVLVGATRVASAARRFVSMPGRGPIATCIDPAEFAEAMSFLRAAGGEARPGWGRIGGLRAWRGASTPALRAAKRNNRGDPMLQMKKLSVAFALCGAAALNATAHAADIKVGIALDLRSLLGARCRGRATVSSWRSRSSAASSAASRRSSSATTSAATRSRPTSSSPASRNATASTSSPARSAPTPRSRRPGAVRRQGALPVGQPRSERLRRREVQPLVLRPVPERHLRRGRRQGRQREGLRTSC